jgi:hypothetical protein
MEKATIRLVKREILRTLFRSYPQTFDPNSSKRVRELRIKIKNETRELDNVPPDPGDIISLQSDEFLHASP